MKKQIRYGIFESNSSSTHTITICTKDEFDAWKNGEIVFDSWNEKFVNNKNMIDEDEDDYLQTYEQWEDEEYLELFTEEYTSPSGDKLVIFGKYGFD